MVEQEWENAEFSCEEIAKVFQGMNTLSSISDKGLVATFHGVLHYSCGQSVAKEDLSQAIHSVQDNLYHNSYFADALLYDLMFCLERNTKEKLLVINQVTSVLTSIIALASENNISFLNAFRCYLFDTYCKDSVEDCRVLLEELDIHNLTSLAIRVLGSPFTCGSDIRKVDKYDVAHSLLGIAYSFVDSWSVDLEFMCFFTLLETVAPRC